jgi:hypothetical protein
LFKTCESWVDIGTEEGGGGEMRVTKVLVGGLGVIATAATVLASAGSYSVVSVIAYFLIGAAPFLAYLTLIRSHRSAIVSGILLLPTLYAYLRFALVPASSRDGIDALWIFLGSFLGIAVVLAGAMLQQRGETNKTEPARISR